MRGWPDRLRQRRGGWSRRVSVVSAVRFWTREIWGPRWDGERRRLLAQHYWSYLRHPAVPERHVPEETAAAIAAQRGCSRGYAHRVIATQESTGCRRGVRLTFRPLGKNLRLLGTAVRRHVDAGCATVIESDGPRDEVASLCSQQRTWHPWLWSRTGDPAEDRPLEGDAAAAWSTLFKLPGHDHPAAAPVTPAADALQGSGGYDPALIERVLKLATATRYVFRPVDPIESGVTGMRRALGWPAPDVPVLGMHVRRGDAASTERGGPVQSTRPSFPLSAYLDAADTLCEARGIRHIFLASESATEIARAQELRPQYTFFSLPHDRSWFPDVASKQFIEHLALTHPERARPLAIAAIQDLRLFCDCRAFVGAFNSEFSVLAWLLAVGSQGHVIPYVSLSLAARRTAWHPHDALLNVKNNCPLELYHW